MESVDTVLMCAGAAFPRVCSPIERMTTIFLTLRSIESLAKDSDAKEKIYINSEDDTNQTTFEIRSNHLELGVIARSSLVGRILLLCLRAIVDSRDIARSALENGIGDTYYNYHAETGDVCVLDVIKELITLVPEYLVSPMTCPEVRTTLNSFDGDLNIARKVEDIELWSIDKIEETLMKMYQV